jgi:hypothetical protein
MIANKLPPLSAGAADAASHHVAFDELDGVERRALGVGLHVVATGFGEAGFRRSVGDADREYVEFEARRRFISLRRPSISHAAMWLRSIAVSLISSARRPARRFQVLSARSIKSGSSGMARIRAGRLIATRRSRPAL